MAKRLAVDMAASLATLGEVEAGARIPAGDFPESRTFVRCRRACLSAPFLARLLSPARAAPAWRIARAVPTLDPLGLALALPFGERARARVAADVVVIKAGLRAFYPDRGLTLKTANPSLAGGSERLRREAAIRRRLRATEAIDAPALLDEGAVGATAYLVEALVEGAHRERRLADPEAFAGRLMAFYLANGAGLRPLAEALDPAAEWEGFRAGATGLGYRVPAGLDAVARDMIRAGGEGSAILWGLCHGDLAVENMIGRADGGTTLIDWEHAREDPIFADVAKLAIGNPAFRARFLAEARALGATRGRTMLDPRLQLVLGGIVAVNRRAAWIANAQAPEDRALALRSFRRKAERLVGTIAGALAELDQERPSSAR